MVVSDKKGARRPDLLLYRPGKGFRSKTSKSEAVGEAGMETTLENISFKDKDSRCNVPIGNDFVRISEECVAIEANVAENGEKQSSKGSDSPKPLNLKSWADQVEEYLSNSSLSNDEVGDNGYVDEIKIEPKSNLLSSVEQLENDYLSANLNDGKADLSCFQEQDPDLISIVQSRSDIFKMLKARDEIIDIQVAFFEKLVVRDNSGKAGVFNKIVVPKNPAAPKTEKVCPPVLPSHVPCASGRSSSDNIWMADSEEIPIFDEMVVPKDPVTPKEVPLPMSFHVSCKPVNDSSDDILKLRADRDRIVDQQLTIFDKKVVPKNPVGPNRVDASTLPSYAPYITMRNSSDDLKLLTRHEPIVDWQVHAPILPSYVPCTKVDHKFCASDCLNSYYSSYLEASSYIPPPRPLLKNDPKFCASGGLALHYSSCLDPSSFIPPPRPPMKNA